MGRDEKKQRQSLRGRIYQSYFNSASTVFSNHMGKQVADAALQTVEVVGAVGCKETVDGSLQQGS